MPFEGFQMADVASGASAVYAGPKILLLAIPVVVTVVAWWLGIYFVPLRKGREWQDMLQRLVACAFSSLSVGLFVLLALHNYAPWLFSSAVALATIAGLPPILGYFAVIGCVLLLCSLPGPWIVVAWFKWWERRKNKDLGQIARDLSDDVRHVVGKDG